MVEVKTVNDKEEWNSKLKKTINYNIFSSYEWGEFKSNSWIIQRLAFYKSGNYLGQCQFLIKKKFGIMISWNSGGLNLVNFKYLDSILKSIENYYKKDNFNIRFNFYDKSCGEKLFNVLHSLKTPPTKINSGFSILHSLKKNDDFIKLMSSNHRYYYKKAAKNSFDIKFGSQDMITDFINLHEQMISLKNLDSIKINKEDILSLSKTFKDNLLIESIYFEGKIVASCLILIFDKQAFYYLAASNEKGRQLFASYFMIKELFEYLVDIEISDFDFAGITPYNKNANGVNKFKMGFGGELINYMGEYDFYNNKLINIIFNKTIKFIK